MKSRLKTKLTRELKTGSTTAGIGELMLRNIGRANQGKIRTGSGRPRAEVNKSRQRRPKLSIEKKNSSNRLQMKSHSSSPQQPSKRSKLQICLR
jgi:hypothetical protein